MEEWKTIEEYPNYQVSNLGRVKSLNYNRTGKEKILKGSKNRGGYLNIILCKEGKVKTFSVHRLVASAFLDNHDNLSEVNHKDEDKTNNTIWINDDGSIDYNKSNLEWCNRYYNNNYGTRKERAIKNKSIPILQFNKEGEFIRKWDSARDIEKELGVNDTHITSCCKGKLKSAYGYVWGYADDYKRIPFKVFDLNIYEKIGKVAIF